MEIEELVRRNRSYRRFDASFRIEKETLLDLVDLARITPSGANLQPLKFVLSNAPERNARIFSTLGWAGYLSDWEGPGEPERPTAYVVVLQDTRIREAAPMDVGIAAQTILLGATERGLGGCMLGSIQRKKLADVLDLPEHLTVALVVALGKPVEKILLEDAEPGGSIKYYRDPKGVHHVPKRRREELIHASHFA